MLVSEPASDVAYWPPAEVVGGDFCIGEGLHWSGSFRVSIALIDKLKFGVPNLVTLSSQPGSDRKPRTGSGAQTVLRAYGAVLPTAAERLQPLTAILRMPRLRGTALGQRP